MESIAKPGTAVRSGERTAWQDLEAHYNQVKNTHLRELFADDPTRGERMNAEAAGVYLDYSKNRITDETLQLLLQLAKEVDLRGKIDAMFRGEKINITENRAVLHIALRAPRGASISLDGKNVVPEVHAVLDRMADFSSRVRDGTWTGHTGKQCATRCQYRDRRVRSRPGDGLRSASALH